MARDRRKTFSHWIDGGRPVINGDVCTGRGRCREICIVEPKAISIALLR
jgi:hypothetical protein